MASALSLSNHLRNDVPKHRFTITFETDFPDSGYPEDLTAEGKLALDIEEISEDYEVLEALLQKSDFVITGEVVYA